MERKNNTERTDKAIIYAVEHHKNTYRKSSHIPYVLHPLEAMNIVANMTTDEDVIVATALHDLIEDTDVTYDDILKEFGKRVADIVWSESKNSIENFENMTWRERKQAEIDKLKVSPIECKMVALGDKLSNIRAIFFDYQTEGDNLWNRFNEKNPKEYGWRYLALLDCFSGLEHTNAYKEFKHLVLKTFK